MIDVFYPILSVLAVSIVSFVGLVALSLNERMLARAVSTFVALAVGALLGDAFLHLIPEAMQSFPSASTAGFLVIAGVLAFFTLEKLLHWHHHHTEENEVALHHGGNRTHGNRVHVAGRLILLSDGLHNFLDGLIIGIAYLTNIEVGVATTIAVILHEIPQEIGDFGVLLHAGYQRGRALFFNFLSALSAVVGAMIALAIGAAGERLIMWFLPIAAGGFVYIAAADLMPELHKSRALSHTLAELAAVGVGVGAMFLLLFIEA